MARLPSAAPAAVKAAVWMVGAVVSFCIMAVSARELAGTMSPYQILLLRSLFGVLFIGVFMVRPDPSIARSEQPRLQAIRHTVHFVGQVLWIVAIAGLPLALVSAVEFTSPLWGALAAVVLLGERVNRSRFLAMAAGLAGVLIIVQPGLAPLEPAMLAIVFAALSFGVTNTMTKKLLATDRPWGILFWMCAVQALLCLPFAMVQWVAPTLADAPWLAGVAISGLTAHYSFARALGMADALVVLPMEFARLPLIAAIGLLAYGEVLDPWILLGALIICLGIWQNLRAEARRTSG